MACAGLLWLVPGLLVMHIGPLGGEKPWCLETSLQLKSSAEPVTAAVKRTIWNLSLANIQAFGFFFSFGEHLCVSWRWTESCGWRKTPLSIPSRSYFSCFAQLLWVNSLSVMSALLWWNLLLQHLDLLKHFSKLCLESFLFFFYSHTHSPFLWKRSRGTNRSVTQISITPCWVCEISRCRDWSLVQSSLKRRMSLSLVGMSPTWNTRELIGQASNSLAVPRNET